MKGVYFLLICLIAFSVGVYGQEELTIDDIIDMVQAGLSDSFVLQTIRISTLEYPPTVEDLVELRRAGVSERLILALMGESSSISTSNVRYRIERRPYSKFQLFGGYSYARNYTNNFSLWTGWNAGTTNNITPWLGIVTDFSGNYGSPLEGTGIVSNLSVFSVLLGPQLSVPVGERLRPFARGLIGVAHMRLEIPHPQIGFDEDSTGLAYGFGGGLDVKVAGRIALRVVQLDYLRMRFTGTYQNNLRASAGIVGMW